MTATDILADDPADRAAAAGATRFRTAPDCVACAFGDGIAILDLRSNLYFSLNAVGAEVWHRLAVPQTEGELVAHVAARFGVAPEVCGPDLARLIAQLAAHRLVERA
ncbi:MAG: PqqD family protein [Rhodobacteraceae bacterium]|nr:PqqD family protein [Paracoccaceae bacterium]